MVHIAIVDVIHSSQKSETRAILFINCAHCDRQLYRFDFETSAIELNDLYLSSHMTTLDY